jgi:hypothetical protein
MFKETIPRINSHRRVNIKFKEGGLKGIGYVGVLRALSERGYVIDKAEGGSYGALAAAFVTNGKTANELLEATLEGLNNRSDLVTFLRTLTPGDPISVFLGGLTDLRPLISDMVDQHVLEPNDQLTVLSYDVLGRRMMRHRGKDNLVTVLSASCALPGMMRSVWYFDTESPTRFPGHSPWPWDVFGIWSTWYDMLSRVCLLVDPGIVAWDETEHVEGPTIVCVLEAATEWPTYALNWWDLRTWVDLYLHGRELSSPRPCSRAIGDPSKVVFIKLGDPEISGLNLSTPRKKLERFVEDCRNRTHAALAQAEAEGRLGVTVH